MVSDENIEFLKAGGRRYIVGTPKSRLKRFEQQLLSQQWRTIRDGLEVQLCACPDGGEETFVLCRSRDRQRKEQAMHERFERRIEEGLAKIAAACARSRQQAGAIERRVGRLLGQNSRAAGLFDIRIRADEHGAAIESTIKQINRRIKGTEKFWDEGGDPMLQLVADRLSHTNAAAQFWSRRLDRLIHASCYHQAS